VVPGKVEPDLLNSTSAATLCPSAGRRRYALDVGCGTGYGAAVLAVSAKGLALDVSESVAFAKEIYQRPIWISGFGLSSDPLGAETVDGGLL
jgi:hypothetical protein